MRDTAKDAAGTLPAFETHPMRDAVLGEVHARPFRPLETPRVVLHYAFTTSAEEAVADHAWLCDVCMSQGLPGPMKSARHHVLELAGGTLSWERHAEFTTYTWNGPAQTLKPFGPLPPKHPFGAAFRAPGPLLMASRVDVCPPPDTEEWRENYDPASLTAFKVLDGAGQAAMDFRPDGDGLTRIVVFNDTMTPIQCGAVVQRLLEIETYRSLALLGLFEANRLQPELGAIEAELVDLTSKMQESAGLEANRSLLAELTRLAATLEAGAVASSYRFGASRAYNEIVKTRVAALREEPIAGSLSLSGFLSRRLSPAMHTCQSIEDRQAMLSRKLARATTLLRTWVDVALEQQNRSLLQSMNRRARLQLRLQHTVEGLSVAAVSYYVVGLISYLAKGAKDAGLPGPGPGTITGLAVPLVVGAIWFTVRRIRSKHAEEHDQDD